MEFSCSSRRINDVCAVRQDRQAEGRRSRRPSASGPADRLGLRHSDRPIVAPILTIALLLVPKASIADIEVPYDAPTIEDAVEMAQPGEPILVYPGDYELAGSIDVWRQDDSKDLRLRAVGGPSVTRVRFRPNGNERFFFIVSSDTLVVEGFTFMVQPRQIAIAWGPNQKFPVVGEGVTIRGNVFQGIWPNPEFGLPDFGTGIDVAGHGVIADNEFYGLGRGITTAPCAGCWNTESGVLPLMLQGNLFRRCYKGVHGHGIGVSVSENEFEECYQGIASEHCTVSNNVIRDCAIGLIVWRESFVERNRISGFQTGILIDDGRNRFVRNILVSSARGLAVDFYGEPYRNDLSSFEKCVIAYGQGGAIEILDYRREYKRNVRFIDSIVWPLPGQEDSPLLWTCLVFGRPERCRPIQEYANIETSHCVIYGRQIDGHGVIQDDPQFWDLEGGDFRLRPTSPCIDAGDPQGDPDPDGSRADIGAFPWDHRSPILIRGDVNADARIDLGDPIQILEYLYAGRRPVCPKAGDVDDDGIVSIGDAIQLLNVLFADGERRPAPPFPKPGEDETPDPLPCGP